MSLHGDEHKGHVKLVELTNRDYHKRLRSGGFRKSSLRSAKTADLAVFTVVVIALTVPVLQRLAVPTIDVPLRTWKGQGCLWPLNPGQLPERLGSDLAAKSQETMHFFSF